MTHENQRVEGVALSPDGKWLVYDANRCGDADVFRILAEGGEAIQLTSDSADDFEPVWLHDGKRIAFYSTATGNRDIYTMEMAGGSLGT